MTGPDHLVGGPGVPLRDHARTALTATAKRVYG